MKKNTEIQAEAGSENELSEATQFEILSKKIISKFFSQSLFARLAITDWEGQIITQGDMVLMRDHTEIIAQYAIPIEEERNLIIFNDIIMVDMVSKRIAMELKDKVEEHILAKNDEAATAHDDIVLSGEIPPQHVHGRLYFVAAIVPVGGYEPKGYGMKFVYGFKIG